MRIIDWSSYVCSSDLRKGGPNGGFALGLAAGIGRGGVRRGTDGGDVDQTFDASGRRGGRHRAGAFRLHRLKALASTLDERSEEHTSELQSLMRISYAVFCLKKKTLTTSHITLNENITRHC